MSNAETRGGSAEASEVFKAAWEAVLEADPADRRAWVERECADRADLRDELLRFIGIEERMGAAPAQPATHLAEQPVLTDGLPSRVGPYTIEGVLGKGGMGWVLRGRQHEPVRRSVAIKVIRPTLNPRLLLDRFDVEKAALARLSHSGIARILDAGADPYSPPYIVMELVEGLPITEYARSEQLPLPDRIDLFIDTAGAIQYAHSRGLIHRDIKPSNILVAVEDGRPKPKVIDFGVAKLLETEDDPHPAAHDSLPGQLVGTLEYMSPEQLAGNGGDLDIRADVYSLGVVLHELVTGSVPFCREVLAGLTATELERFTQAGEPPRPVVACAEPGGSPGRPVDKDLSFIMLKAIAKDRERRYRSVQELIDDLGRYTRGEAVLARAPSRAYRVRKFVRRHRVAVGVTAAVAAILIAATLVSTFALGGAVHERDRARALQRTATATTEYLRQVLNEVRPERLGPDATLRQLLSHVADEFEAAAPEDPAGRANAAFAIGEPIFAMADYARASAVLEAGRAAASADGQAADLWARLSFLAAQTQMASGEHDAALATIEELLGSDAADDPTLRARSRTLRANLFLLRGDYEAAIEQKRLVLAELRDTDADPGAMAFALRSLARSLTMTGEMAEATALSGEAYEISFQTLPPEHAGLLQSAIGYATALITSGLPAEAAEILRPRVEVARATLGPDHAEVAFAAMLLATSLSQTGEHADAIEQAGQVLENDTLRQSVPVAQWLGWRSLLPGILIRAGRTDEAIDAADSLEAALLSDEAITPQQRAETRLSAGFALIPTDASSRGAELLAAAHTDLVEAGRGDSDLARRVSRSLAQHFVAIGDPGTAAAWRSKAE